MVSGFSRLPVRLFAAGTCVLFLFIFRITDAHNAQNPEDWKEIGLDDKTGQKIPLDLRFPDERGDTHSLAVLINRPTLLVPVYYSCQQACAIMLGNVAAALNQLPLTPGKDFRVISLSFDETETPSLALETQKRYLKILNRDFAPDDWKFLTGDSLSIRRLTDAAGYRFKRTGKHDFAHPNVVMVLSRDKTLIRYLYGPEFLAFDMGMALTEAARGTPSITIRKMLSYCFAYDPKNKSYTFRAAQFVTLGVFLFLGLGLFVVLRKKRL